MTTPTSAITLNPVNGTLTGMIVTSTELSDGNNINSELEISVDLSESANEGCTDSPRDNVGALCVKYSAKIQKLLSKYDNALQSNQYTVVQRHAEFASLYAKLNSFLHKKTSQLKKNEQVTRRPWKYMFQQWLEYAANNPKKKHIVSIRLYPKLNNWVKEQRKKYCNGTLKLDRYEQLNAVGFLFKPRPRRVPNDQEISTAITTSSNDLVSSPLKIAPTIKHCGMDVNVYQESTDNRESIGYAISITNATLPDDLVCSSLVNRGGQEIVVINDDEQDPETVDRKCYVDSLAKDLAPLSPEERLKYLLKSKYVDGSYNKFIAFSIDKFQISFGDYSRFLNERWITDEVVNAYFYLLEEKFGSPSICFGYSYWYTHNMQPENADACQLQRILSKKVMDDLSILFLPVNINNNHWMLAVINFMLHDIDLYDSLDGENDDVSRVLMKWFPALYGNPPYWKVWNHYNDNTIQRQQDLHNCAFFTCWYASQLAMMESKPNSGASIMQWTDNWAGKLKSIRDDVMSSLLNRFVNNWSMLAH